MMTLLPVLIGLVLLIGGTGLSYRAATDLRPVYEILTTEPLSVRELPTKTGAVEVAGEARLGESGDTVRAPLTLTECLAYEYEAAELRSSGKSAHWKTLDEDAAAAPFRLEDDTGIVRVDHEAATLDLTEHSIRVSGGEEPPPVIAQYIRQTEAVDPQNNSVDLVVTELDYGNDQRFVERRLDIGESAHVYGVVEPAPGGEWGSDLVDARLTNDEETPLVVSDSSERGTAWQLAKRPLLLAGVGVIALLGGIGGILWGVSWV
jgi:hypothetical protein